MPRNETSACLALRAACPIFVNASNAAVKDIGIEGEEQFCLSAPSFIGRIWMDSVRSLIHNEFSGRSEIFGHSSCVLTNLRTFKLRVCNYLRSFFVALLPASAGSRLLFLPLPNF